MKNMPVCRSQLTERQGAGEHRQALVGEQHFVIADAALVNQIGAARSASCCLRSSV